jgi:periplasmic protein TonB
MPPVHGDTSLTSRHPGLMQAGPRRWDASKSAALLVVLALHGAVLYGLWSARLIPHPADAVTLFVNLISPSPPPTPDVPSSPEAAPAPPSPVKPIQREAPRPIQSPHPLLASEAPVVAPTDATALRPPIEEPIPPIASAAPAASPAPPRPAGPVALDSHLALACPVRTPPSYPPVSRRLGETGKVVLRVELDETGRVSLAQVINSSGYKRLDEAALAAVRSWRCQPAQRDGQAVRSVAVQPFEFTLEGQ